MTSNLIEKQFQELKRVENILSKFQDAGPSPDPDKLSPTHIMLLEERNKLTNNINRQSNAFGVNNPLIPHNQKVNNTNKNQLQRVDSTKLNNDTSRQQVSPEERQKACDELVPNGCGARGDWKSDFIPNKPEGFDFTEACNNHDRNFGTLGVSFSEANNQFYIDMVSAVRRIAEPGTVIYKGGVNLAKLYFDKVVEHGRPAYETAQINAYICKYGKKPDE